MKDIKDYIINENKSDIINGEDIITLIRAAHAQKRELKWMFGDKELVIATGCAPGENNTYIIQLEEK